MSEMESEAETKQRARRALAQDSSPVTKFWCTAVLRGTSTIKNIGRSFRVIDTDNTKTLDKEEFKQVNKMWKMNLSAKEVTELWDMFRGEDDKIDYEEFLEAIRPPMNDARKRVVEKAFRRIQTIVQQAREDEARRLLEVEQAQKGMQQKQLDSPPSTAGGERPDYITVDDMSYIYNVSNHPLYQNGQKTEEQILMDFIALYQGEETMDDKITLEEFMDFYRVVGLSVDSDAAFNYMMQMSWHKKQTNRRAVKLLL